MGFVVDNSSGHITQYSGVHASREQNQPSTEPEKRRATRRGNMLRYGAGDDDWGTGSSSVAHDDYFRGPTHRSLAGLATSGAHSSGTDDTETADSSPPQPLDPAVRERLLRRFLHDAGTSDQPPLPDDAVTGSIEFFSNAAAGSEECSICESWAAAITTAKSPMSEACLRNQSQVSQVHFLNFFQIAIALYW